MAVDPDAFDVPVVDYDFSKATTPRALIEQMAQAVASPPPNLLKHEPSSRT